MHKLELGSVFPTFNAENVYISHVGFINFKAYFYTQQRNFKEERVSMEGGRVSSKVKMKIMPP